MPDEIDLSDYGVPPLQDRIDRWGEDLIFPESGTVSDRVYHVLSNLGPKEIHGVRSLVKKRKKERRGILEKFEPTVSRIPDSNFKTEVVAALNRAPEGTGVYFIEDWESPATPIKKVILHYRSGRKKTISV